MNDIIEFVLLGVLIAVAAFFGTRFFLRKKKMQVDEEMSRDPNYVWVGGKDHPFSKKPKKPVDSEEEEECIDDFAELSVNAESEEEE